MPEAYLKEHLAPGDLVVWDYTSEHPRDPYRGGLVAGRKYVLWAVGDLQVRLINERHEDAVYYRSRFRKVGRLKPGDTLVALPGYGFCGLQPGQAYEVTECEPYWLRVAGVPYDLFFNAFRLPRAEEDVVCNLSGRLTAGNVDGDHSFVTADGTQVSIVRPWVPTVGDDVSVGGETNLRILFVTKTGVVLQHLGSGVQRKLSRQEFNTIATHAKTGKRPHVPHR
jgi:hypothetical protein